MEMLRYVSLRVRKFFDGVVGRTKFDGERVVDIFNERNNLRREYGKLVGTIGDVWMTVEEIKREEATYRANMLLDKVPCLDGDTVRSAGINKALLDLAREERTERVKVIGQIEKIRRKHLEYVVRTICEDEKVKSATAMVYYRGDVLYATGKFEKKFGSNYAIEKFLNENVGLNVDLEMGKGVVVEYNGESLFFVPDKRGRSLVSVAYFVSHKGKGMVDLFEKTGKRAAKIIHNSLRAEKIDGLEFA